MAQTAIKYRPYPKYKSSAINWLGDLPEGWEIKRLKYEARIIMGQSPDSDNCNKDQSGIPFLQGNADFGTVNPIPLNWCCRPRKLAGPEDFLISVRAPVGELNKADQEYAIGRGLCAIRFNKAIDDKFAWYLLSVSKIQLYPESTGSTYDAVSTDKVGNMAIPLPSLSEQRSIANFLDRDTTKIDEVIARKQKLIELLKEKRQALITHAVTKGLDPNAKLKPSGIEWLGDIPEGWEVKRLRYVSKVNLKTLPEDTDKEYVFKYLDIGNVGTGYLINQPIELIFESSPSRARRIVEKNNTIISTVRTYLKAIYFFESNEKDLIVSTGFAVLEPMKDINPKFLYYLALSEHFIDSVVSNSVGVSYPAINESVLAELPVWYPNIEEQHRIVDFLDTETAKIDCVTAKVKTQIEKLQEYRQALITSAVTGKIKVSGDCAT